MKILQPSNFPTAKCPDQVWTNVSSQIKKHQKKTFSSLRIRAFKKTLKYSIFAFILFVLWFLWILNQKLSNTETVVAQQIDETSNEIDQLLLTVDNKKTRVDFDNLEE